MLAITSIIFIIGFASDVFTKTTITDIVGTSQQDGVYHFSAKNIKAIPQAGLTVQTEAMTIATNVHSFDIDVAANSPKLLHSAKLTWLIILQWIVRILKASILIISIIICIKLLRLVKNRQSFPQKKLMLMHILGITIIVASLLSDTTAYLQSYIVRDLLQGQAWQPSTEFAISGSRLFLGLAIILIDATFRIGRELEEERDLTI